MENQSNTRLERTYFITAIVAAICAVAFPICDFFTNSGNQPNANNGSIVADGNGNSVAGAGANGEESSASSASASGEGSSASSTIIEGDNNNYYSVPPSPDPDLNNAYSPSSFESNEERLLYSADLIEGGEYKEAYDFLTEFLKMEETGELDKQMASAVRYNRGICNLYRKDYNLAVADLENVAPDSDNAEVYYNLGCAYCGCKNYPEAVHAFSKAQELGKDASGADKTRYSEALERAEQYEREYPDSSSGSQ